MISKHQRRARARRNGRRGNKSGTTMDALIEKLKRNRESYLAVQGTSWANEYTYS